MTLRDFPLGLEELSLRRTYVKNSDYFFQHSVKSMPKLRVFIFLIFEIYIILLQYIAGTDFGWVFVGNMQFFIVCFQIWTFGNNFHSEMFKGSFEYDTIFECCQAGLQKAENFWLPVHR